MQPPRSVYAEMQVMSRAAPKQAMLGYWFGYAIAFGLLAAIVVATGLFDRGNFRWLGDVKIAMMLVTLPTLFLGAYLGVKITKRLERPTLPFEFPLTFDLPGFFVWSSADADALFLHRRRTLVCLFRRAPSASVRDVLRELLSDDQLRDVTEAAAHCEFALAGTPTAIGRLQAYAAAPGAYALMLASDDFLARDTTSKLVLGAGVRAPDAPPQKWRPMPVLGKGVVPASRVVSR